MPNKYEFDAVRWCRTMREYYATRTDNASMAKNFGRAADEIQRLRARVARLEEVLKAIADDETDYPREIARRALEEK